MKKFALLLILLLTAACGRGGDEDFADENPLHIGGGSGLGSYYSGTGMAPIRLMVPGTALESDPLAILLATQFNLAITFAAYPSDFDEMMHTLTAADNRPDMFLMALTPARLHRLANEGIIRSIPDTMLEQFPRLNTVVFQDPIAQANRRIYGAVGYIPCVYDYSPIYAADAGRFLYRKDWADILNLTSFDTTEDIYNAARTFARESNPNRPHDGTALIGIAVDKPERFAYMYGLDPKGWVLEGDRYIPVFYSDRMLQPLTFARRLYTEGLLTFSSHVTLNDAGIIVADVSTSEDLMNIINPVARSLRTSADQVLAQHVAIMNPPHAPGVRAAWGTSYRTEGWLAQESLADGIMVRFLEMLDFSLSSEGIDYARYGFLDETFTRHEGRVHLFTDPMTYRAYDLDALYPTGQFLLGLLSHDAGRDADLFYPSSIPTAARTAAHRATLRYYNPIEPPDALCRTVHSPLRDAVSIDYNAYFYNIIAGDEPVADMFARYKEACVNHGTENAIREVNNIIRRVP